ncbi:putative GTP-binding protein, mitochondrial [Colletotrichum spaethianum]|uniref:GTP-binding protein, mitochondrial n=1 Tax=Colletotrichum spaethianum TaxID=700344 RepID=A0AA37P2H9_9PEZI|nr:putative GTP-binding protein, mitochondrial [Colletotrichum spaethianum]GKT46478.1 putative GTP-binding protein, mitochondrial [Colletotrichum spaethianum]
MLKNACRCRAIVQRQCPPTQRWLSTTPTRTYNPRPQPDADGWYDGRRHPSRHEEPGFEKPKPRDEYSGRDGRISSSSRMGASYRRPDRFNPRDYRDAPRDDRGRDGRFSSPSRTDPPRRSRPLRPKIQAPKRKGGGFVLMPKLSQEELDKINTPKDVWEARSLYYRNRNTGIASASAIKAAIQGISTDPKPSPPPPLPELEGDGGAIVASHVRDLPHAQAARFFLSPPATFLYSAFRLKHHPINTTTPEICVVGASNCGKSSFINALANAASLAKVSDRAGKTVSMNAYGVGPLTGLPFRKPVAAEGGGATKEERPEHGIVLVDTPGYGYASHEEWGQEIVEYINKRTMLRGIILLLSSEKKVSEKDAQIVKLLADAGRPVMLVFTKMDKALLRRAREEGGIAERLREAERCFARTGWDGWVKKVYITAARMERDKSWKVDGTGSAAGMAGVRMGVLELAGIREFVAPERARVSSPKTGTGTAEEEKRLEPGKALESDPAAWSGDVVSFEELEKKFGDWSS